MKKIREYFANREHGFSLLEMSIAVGIMAIGLTVALPNFNNAIQTQQANDVKNNIIQSGMILEQARYTNDGSYPTQATMPAEISGNAKYSAFTYSTDSASQTYCIMGRDSLGQKYYLSSAQPGNVYVPSEENQGCGNDGGAVCISTDQTNCPKSPVIATPTVTGSNTWTDTNYSAALATMNWGSSTCNWSGSAPTNAGPIGGIDYQARVVQNSTSGLIFNAFNGSYVSANSATNISLDGLQPNTSIKYQVRVRCLADFEYYYTPWVSATTDTVKDFPLPRPKIVTPPGVTTTWASGQTNGTATFSVSPISCPTVNYTPVYKATLTQSGNTINAPSLSSNSGWQTSNTFSVALVTSGGYVFAPGTNSFGTSVDGACQIGSTFFASNGAVGSTPNVDLAPPPPTQPANIVCITKYKRLTENNTNIGGCNSDPESPTAPNQQPDTTIPAATLTPDGVRWTPSVCQFGTVGYQAATASGSAGVLGSYGAYSNITTVSATNLSGKRQYNFSNGGWTAGAYMGVKIVAYCTYNSLTSSVTNAAESKFTTNTPPPTPSAPSITWSASTAGTGATGNWSDVTTTQGTGWLGTDGFMYDRVSGTYTTPCSGGVLPSGWNVYITASFPNGTSQSLPTYLAVAGSTLTFDRSSWTEAQNGYWVRGAAVSFNAMAKCPSSDGVYDGYNSLLSSSSAKYQIGYPQIATDVVVPSCVTKYILSTNASKGNCIQDAFTANNVLSPATMPASSLSMSPNALKWDAPSGNAACTTGYSPTYAVYSPITATYGAFSTSRLYYLSGLSATGYTFKVKFKCTATNGVVGTSSAAAALSSTESIDNNAVFTASNPPSFATPASPSLTLTPTTDDSSWTITAQQGGYDTPQSASYLYDRINGVLGTPTVCPSGYTEQSVRYSLSMPSSSWSIRTYAQWGFSTAYTVGTIVIGPDGNYWQALQASTGVVPTSGSVWSPVTYSLWSSATTYSVGNIVKDTSGRLWIATASNLNKDPEGVATPINSTLSGGTATINRSTASSFLSTWAEGAVLSVSPSVTCYSPDYGNYITTSAPAAPTSISIGFTAPTELISSFNCSVVDQRTGTGKLEINMGNCGTIAYGTYSTATAYVVGSKVIDSSGYLWIALANNTNSVPSTTNANWASMKVPTELSWGAVSATACDAKPASPRYWISADNGSTWTKLGVGVTSYAIGNNLTAGTSYTYAVRYDCYDSTSTRYSAPSASSTKTFTASHPLLKAGAIDAQIASSATITWAANESDTWANCPFAVSSECGTLSITTLLMLDYASATLAGTPCPTGYALPATTWTPYQNGVTGSPVVTTNSATTLVFKRSNNSTNWIEGAHLGYVVSASLNCSNSDYNSVVKSSALKPSTSDAAYQIGVRRPTLPATATAANSETGILANGTKQGAFTPQRYYTPLSEYIVTNPSTTYPDTKGTPTATQWIVTDLPTCITSVSTVTPIFTVTSYDPNGAAQTPRSTALAGAGDTVTSPVALYNALTATAYAGGITRATLGGTCNNSAAINAGLSSNTITSAAKSTTLTSKVYESPFTKMTISDTGYASDWIKGSYDASPCRTGQTSSGSYAGYVGYNGTGVTAAYDAYSEANGDSGAFTGTGVVTTQVTNAAASPVGDATTFYWDWNSYTSIPKQVYGVRITGKTCTNKTADPVSGTLSYSTTVKGWVTWWLKVSTGSRNGPGYTNASSGMGTNTYLWSPQ